MPQITAEFEETYRGLYGRKGPDVALEIINWRVVASGPRPEMNFKLPRDTSSRGDARKGSRRAYFPERADYLDTAVYDRYALAPGATVKGPALIEERESTCVIGSGQSATVDAHYNLVADLAL